MIIWLDLFVPMKLELIVGRVTPRSVPVVLAESELCDPVTLLLNPPDTNVDVPVKLCDCRGIFFQLMATMPPTPGVCVNVPLELSCT